MDIGEIIGIGGQATVFDRKKIEIQRQNENSSNTEKGKKGDEKTKIMRTKGIKILSIGGVHGRGLMRHLMKSEKLKCG